LVRLTLEVSAFKARAGFRWSEFVIREMVGFTGEIKNELGRFSYLGMTNPNIREGGSINVEVGEPFIIRVQVAVGSPNGSALTYRLKLPNGAVVFNGAFSEGSWWNESEFVLTPAMVKTPAPPVEATSTELINFLQAYTDNTYNPIESRNTARQIIESYGRNDLTFEQLKNLVTSFENLTPEDIEEMEIDDELIRTLESNLNIILNQNKILLDKAFDFANQIQSGQLIGVPVEGQDPSQAGGLELRDLHELMKQGLSELITVSIPRAVANLHEIIKSFSDNRIEISQTKLDEIRNTEDRIQEITVLGAALIDEAPALLRIAGIPIADIKRIIV